MHMSVCACVCVCISPYAYRLCRLHFALPKKGRIAEKCLNIPYIFMCVFVRVRVWVCGWLGRCGLTLNP